MGAFLRHHMPIESTLDSSQYLPVGAVIFYFRIDNLIEGPHIDEMEELRKQLNCKGSIYPTFS